MCIKSKAVRLIILLVLLTFIGYGFSISSIVYLLRINMNLLQNTSNTILILCQSGSMALLLLFSPIGGWIGDVRCGRYKIIKTSLLFSIIMSIIPIVVSCINLVLLKHPEVFVNSGAMAVTLTVFVCHVVISIGGYISFLANIVPFAMDQLRDAPAKESSLFIYWYVWTFLLSFLIQSVIFGIIFNGNNMFKFNPNTPLNLGKFTETLSISVAILMIVISILVLICLIVFRIILQKREKWFNVEPGDINPYKLVYKVTKFAFQHKIPVRRSAFTYCEDEPPSRLDLGKSKYGGPFTTEQVEDVKVFYEILKLLVSLGPVWYLLTVDQSTFSLGTQLHDYYIKPGMLSNLVIVVAIPLYLLLCRCSNLCSLPIFRSLTKIEIGTIIMLLNMVYKLGVNIVADVRNEEFNCMLMLEENVHRAPLEMASILIVQILSGIAKMLLYISFFEFICAQSPHSMKGMLIGLAYFINGFSRLVALIFQIPFLKWKPSYPSCGFVYYSMNVVIGLISFIILMWVAKRYKYRERNEPSRVRQFAEANVQPERLYDYSIST